MGKRANGEGTIYYRKDRKKYYGYFWIDLPDGTRKREAVTPDKERRVVSARLTEAMAQANNKSYIIKNDTTIKDLVFLRYYPAMGG